MHRLNNNSVGLALGIFSALLHGVWAVLVFLGAAGPLVKFLHGIHFVKTTVSVTSFDLGNAVLLIVIAGAIGYVLGYVFAAVWNRTYRA